MSTHTTTHREENGMRECECHRESGSHELCCGHPEGRNPDCPLHGDGSTGRSTGVRL